MKGMKSETAHIIDLGPIYFNFKVKGNYAIWMAGTLPTTPITLTLRDLLAGTNVVTITNANIYTYWNDVAANGDMVYWTYDDQLYRYRSGTSTQVGSGSYPITDGVNVLYVKNYVAPYQFGDFALFDGTNETILGPQPGLAVYSRALSAGWTAFTKPGTGQTQVWTRSPYGVQTQRTFFGSSSEVFALAPGGDLMINSGPPDWRLRFIPTGPPSIDLPTDLGPWNLPSSLPFWSKGTGTPP